MPTTERVMRDLTNNFLAAPPLPPVSVIMPVRNEAGYIERSLRSVFRQTYPHDKLEIIVADGTSTDATVAIIERLKSETNIPLRVISNHRRIAPAALNLGIKNSSGEILVRVDGHCEIAPDYVANCVKILGEKKFEAVGGPIETMGETTTALAIACAMSSKFGVGGSAFRCGSEEERCVDTVAFPAYKRETFRSVGLFDEELVRNQDDEFNYRLRKAGGKILLTPHIRSKYYSRGNFKSLWRQYFQYGCWKVRIFQLHPKQMSRRQFAPLVFVLSLLIFAAAAFFMPFAKIFFLGIIVLYGTANMTATLLQAERVGFRLLPLVSVSFVILHLAYGMGFLAGLYKFRGRWKRAATETGEAAVKI